MGNISSGLKKFLSNKNTVTVVGIVVAIFVLYFAYNWRVNQATNPVTVPYARQQISPGTQITESMVGTRQVPPSMLQGDVVRSASAVIDKLPLGYNFNVGISLSKSYISSTCSYFNITCSPNTCKSA